MIVINQLVLSYDLDIFNRSGRTNLNFEIFLEISISK